MSFSSRKIIAKIRGVDYYLPPAKMAQKKIFNENGKVLPDDTIKNILTSLSSSAAGLYHYKDDNKDEKKQDHVILKGEKSAYVLNEHEDFLAGQGVWSKVYYLPDLETGEWRVVKVFSKKWTLLSRK